MAERAAPAPDAPEAAGRDRVDTVAMPRRANLPAVLVLLCLLAGLLFAAYLIFAPFAAPLVLALVFAISGYPLFEWVLRKLGGHRRALASALTCGALILVVFVPLGWLAWTVAHEIPSRQEIEDYRDAFKKRFEASSLYRGNNWIRERWDALWRLAPGAPVPPQPAASPAPGAAPAGAETPAGTGTGAQAGTGTAVKPAPARAGNGAGDPGAASDADVFEQFRSQLSGTAALVKAYLLPFVFGTFEISLKFCLMVFALFFFFKDAAPLVRSVERQIPLPRNQQQRIANTFVLVSRSIIRGTLGTALAQGLCATIIYLIIGVPAIFWGFFTTLAALVPPLGIWFITGPMALLAWIDGERWQPILLVVASIVISLLDNVIKPLLMREGIRVHSLWLLLSLLGGLNAFGAMGIIYGPMVLVLLGTCVTLFVRQEGGEKSAA